MTFTIRALEELDGTLVKGLLAASLAEGYTFVEKLLDDYLSGRHRYDGEGAVLLGAWDHAMLIAVGGVHQDPYLADPRIGRVQHVYVLPGCRRAGVGGALVKNLITSARPHFDFLTLRTPTAHGDAFYRALGFTTSPRFEHATHWLQLQDG